MKTYNIRKIELEQTDSTNTYAATLPVPAADEIVVVSTPRQTAGRGQRGNSWESEAGKNLTFSMMCSPVFIRPARQFSLLQAEALAVYDVLADIVPDVSIKWPNDIYIGSRKVSGTLIECEVENDVLKRAILGTGVNVNQHRFTSDAPNPVSLIMETGKEWNCKILLDSIIRRFVYYYAILASGRDVQIAYIASLFRRTGMHPYHDAKQQFMAEFVNVEADGHLLLRDSAGKMRRYAFKEVTFEL